MGAEYVKYIYRTRIPVDGLQLNREKSEIITQSGDWMEHLALQQFIPSAPEKACLLGLESTAIARVQQRNWRQ